MAHLSTGKVKPGETIEIKNKKTTLKSMQSEIRQSDENQSIMAEVINAARQAILLPKVKSDQELSERLDDYFRIAAERRIPPTVEQMSLYCGVTSETIRAWRDGKNKPFGTNETSFIVKRAYEILHNIDTVLAEMNKTNTVAYIFRAKNYYGMVDKQEITVSANENDGTMSRDQIEEIAAALPDGSIQADATIK